MFPIALLIMVALFIILLKVRKISSWPQKKVRALRDGELKDSMLDFTKRRFRCPPKPLLLVLYFVVLLAAVLLTMHSRESVSEELYHDAMSFLQNGEYERAIEYFSQLNNYKDSSLQAEIAQNFIVYNSAKDLLEEGKFKEAAQVFESLDGFEESAELLNETLYLYAIEEFETENYEEAGSVFDQLGDYKNSKSYAARISLILYEGKQETVYAEACSLFKQGEYEQAMQEFEELGNYLDSAELAQKCKDAFKRKSLASAISAGIRYVAGVTKDQRAVSTGYNQDGQSNLSEWENIVSIAAKGTITVGLQSDGKVLASHQRKDINVEVWEDIIAVAAGEQYIVVLQNDGTLDSQGHDMGDGQRKVDKWHDIVAIAAGWRHTVALDKNGKVFITGFGDDSQLDQIKSNQNDPTKRWENIIAISAGGGSNESPGAGHTVGLRSDGHVVAVGDNEYGQCDVEGWENIIAIAAGDWHTVGLRSDGTVVSTKPDPNEHPELYLDACNVEDADWTGIVEISAGCGITVGLKEDGSVIVTGYNDYSQCDIAGSWKNLFVPERTK